MTILRITGPTSFAFIFTQELLKYLRPEGKTRLAIAERFERSLEENLREKLGLIKNIFDELI